MTRIDRSMIDMIELLEEYLPRHVELRCEMDAYARSFLFVFIDRWHQTIGADPVAYEQRVPQEEIDVAPSRDFMFHIFMRVVQQGMTVLMRHRVDSWIAHMPRNIDKVREARHRFDRAFEFGVLPDDVRLKSRKTLELIRSPLPPNIRKIRE